MGVIEESSTGEPLGQAGDIIPKESGVDDTPKEVQDIKPASTQEETTTPAPSGSSSPHRRPLTRSQTGTVPKRRKRDDSADLAASRKRAPAPRKKQNTSSVSASPNSSVPPEDARSQSPRPPATRETSLTSSASSGVIPSDGQLTFYHASPMSEEQTECRLPRSRASLPTPIPNLTKKSRGRRVPTQSAGNSDPDQKDQRLYVCTVTGCGKCFHRGEHLKRHIRSIHTHEKPFKCSFPLCQKYFNRHDNLLQHLKVHRDVAKDDDPVPEPTSQYASASTSAAPHANAPSPPLISYRRERSYSPSDEPQSPVTTSMTNNSIPRTIYNAFPMSYHNSYPAPMSYGTTSNTISLITNMAVSSLRTELPHSPGADPRGGMLQSGPY